MAAKFSWEFNVINKKIDKRIQQSGDDYTTLSTTTKNDRKILTIYIYIYAEREFMTLYLYTMAPCRRVMVVEMCAVLKISGFSM